MAFTLQTAVLTNMSKIKRRIDSLGITGEVVFVERCPAAADIFVDLGKARGNFTEVEHAHYYMLRKLVNWEPDIRICLQAPVDECHRRMQNRAREEETELMRDALEYMNTLEAAYTTRLAGTNAIVVDAMCPTTQLANNIEEVLQSRIWDF